jgi:UPF0755 protein
MIRKILILVFVVILIAGAWVGWNLKSMIFGKSVTRQYILYIPTDAGYDEVLAQIKSCSCIEDWQDFDQVAQWKKYPQLVKPGKYSLTPGMSNEELVNKLRIGEQEAVHLTFNNIRTLRQLGGKAAHYLEGDSILFCTYLLNPETAPSYGFTLKQFPAMFIPNTYQFKWNTSPEKFVERMAQEFKAFWNEERLTKARKLRLSQSEVTTIASIVEEETKKADEKPRVAGVYLNRIRKGMKLQADPTVVFAVGDFSIRRVNNAHKLTNSPYNTYMYSGLPPGPIRIPEISSIEAVLNAEKHNYLYFCAREDFSGYHNFAENYSQHLRNARQYQAMLNKRKIFK